MYIIYIYIYIFINIYKYIAFSSALVHGTQYAFAPNTRGARLRSSSAAAAIASRSPWTIMSALSMTTTGVHGGRRRRST